MTGRVGLGLIHGKGGTKYRFAGPHRLAPAADLLNERCDGTGFAGFTDAYNGQ